MYGYFAITCIHRQTDSQILLLFCAHAGRQTAPNACMFDWFLHLFDAHVQVGTDNISLSLFVSLSLCLSLSLSLLSLYIDVYTYMHAYMHAYAGRERVRESPLLCASKSFFAPCPELRKFVAKCWQKPKEILRPYGVHEYLTKEPGLGR